MPAQIAVFHKSGALFGWIRTHFDQPLRIKQVADVAGMSLSTFHRHFKAATAMSPLQYRKMIRLQRARRLLVIENHEATEVAYTVGYESPSQFTREYARQFGSPPARDAAHLRSTTMVFDETVRENHPGFRAPDILLFSPSWQRPVSVPFSLGLRRPAS